MSCPLPSASVNLADHSQHVASTLLTRYASSKPPSDTPSGSLDASWAITPAQRPLSPPICHHGRTKMTNRGGGGVVTYPPPRFFSQRSWVTFSWMYLRVICATSALYIQRGVRSREEIHSFHFERAFFQNSSHVFFFLLKQSGVNLDSWGMIDHVDHKRSLCARPKKCEASFLNVQVGAGRRKPSWSGLMPDTEI